MFELTRDWVRERKAFGKRVADLQTVLRLFISFSQFFGRIRNSTSSGPTQASRAQDCSHRMQSFLGLVPFTAQQVEAGQRDVEHGQVLGHRPAEQGGWRVPTTSRRFPTCPLYKKNTMPAQVGVSCGRLRSPSATPTQGCRPSTLAQMRS